MKLALIGDIHGQLKKLRQLVDYINHDYFTKTDAIFLSGDIGGYYLSYNDKDDWTPKKNKEHNPSFKYTKSIREVLKILSLLKKDMPIFYVPGNHDYSNLHDIIDFIKASTPEVKHLNIQNVDQKMVSFLGYSISGKGGAPLTVAMPYGFDDSQLQSKEDLLRSDIKPTLCLDYWKECDIFLSHCPPKGILDGKNYGSDLILDMLTVDCPNEHKLFLCGHIHESFGHGYIEEIKTTFVNGGSLGEPYPNTLVTYVDFSSFKEAEVQMKHLYGANEDTKYNFTLEN
ncbi:metallophosphoesterase family protein [Candidatus Nomurabacteria bacterium]|nr:metallophosphoesterase family protein [Candidatus Nomurabacteria bacterium]